MESSFPDKQRIVQTASNVFWIMQLTRDISEDDEQHLLRITPWRSIGKLYGWFHYTSQDNERTWRKNHLVFEDCRKAQLVFQNRTRKDQSH